MFVQELQEHAAAAAEGHAGKFDAGETIIHHVANSSLDEPLIRLPSVMGIDMSITKHVMMLWIVALLLFVIVTWAVRRYLKQDRLIPSGFMNGLEAVVIFIRDDIVQPNVGEKWVMTADTPALGAPTTTIVSASGDSPKRRNSSSAPSA